MVDVKGDPLRIGDTVVCVDKYSKNSLVIGTIVRFTPQKARIEWEGNENDTYDKLYYPSEIYKIEKCQ